MLLRTIAFHNKTLISGSVVIRNRPNQAWVGRSPLPYSLQYVLFPWIKRKFTDMLNTLYSSVLIMDTETYCVISWARLLWERASVRILHMFLTFFGRKTFGFYGSLIGTNCYFGANPESAKTNRFAQKNC